ncbi:hypothetical protein [Chlamydia sp. 17-3921]|uniref:hypothetical protein n=1 Tax=Chlamydia sp. 17-3921 TaxID=2675798 RepID=UPI001919C8E3|nr:hypothetical protein [Chlamydia sp. 17-3921]
MMTETASLPNSLSSIGTQTLLSYTEIKTTSRRTTCRLLVDIMIIILGLGTISSIFVVLFFLCGLDMLSVSVIAIASILVVLGLLCIGLGLYFVVSTLNSSLIGVLQKQLTESEEELSVLYKKVASLQEQLSVSENKVFSEN